MLLKFHKWPAPAPEQAVVGDHFHILPLLPMLDGGQFWLSRVSAARTRLYQGTCRTFAEVTGLDLPQGVGEVRGETELPSLRHGGRIMPVERAALPAPGLAAALLGY